MTMEELYQQMKSALDFFGLRFHAMDKVEVIIQGDFVIFKYGNMQVSICNEKP